MKLSTKTRYTVRALLDLAIHYKGKPSQIKDIARRQDLSTRYLENLFSSLRAGGILSSSKGKGGGFTLNESPSKINLLDVIEAVEGRICLAGCVDSTTFCKKYADCITRDIWSRANITLRNFFKSITLKDLMEDYKKRIKKTEEGMYYI